MNGIRTRIGVALVATLACAACGISDDGSNRTVDETMARELAAAPPLTRAELEAEFASIDSDELLGEPKIRHGIDIDWDDGLGRTVVELPGCTGQVINRWLILTAAHCMSGILPIGVGDITVRFTPQNAPAIDVYSGTALGWSQENWEFHYKDAAMIFLVDGMDTCHGDLGECSGSAIPNNAVFQWFDTESPLFLASQYFIVGYGTTDDANGFGALRLGAMNRTTTLFNGDNTGLTHLLHWSHPDDFRPCNGDSGGPLVTPFSRLLHTGIASGGDDCTAAAGPVTYSGLTEAQLLFVASFANDMRNEFGLPFHCGLGLDAPSGLGLFHCDNDGTLH